tara:strand:+ start:423 stop:1529 length:1107 start_codon:yes stop_codon:yes gene_type:complete
MKLTKITLILILPPIVLLTGCSTTPVEKTINPKGLLAEDLATIVGGDNRENGRSRISNIYDVDGQKIGDRYYADEVNLEAGRYNIGGYCLFESGAEAWPYTHAELAVGETYKVDCIYCSTQKDWLLVFDQSKYYAGISLIPWPELEQADFNKILNAAMLGNHLAYMPVARAYFTGQHSDSENERNLEKAFAWASMALSNGDTEATTLLDDISVQLSDLRSAGILENLYYQRYWPRIEQCGKDKSKQPTGGKNYDSMSIDRTTKVVFFNASEFIPISVGVTLNGDFAASIEVKKYSIIYLAQGEYDLKLSHIDGFMFNDDYKLHIGENTLFIEVFNTVFATKYKVYREKPANFHSKYIRNNRYLVNVSE